MCTLKGRAAARRFCRVGDVGDAGYVFQSTCMPRSRQKTVLRGSRRYAPACPAGIKDGRSPCRRPNDIRKLIAMQRLRKGSIAQQCAPETAWHSPRGGRATQAQLEATGKLENLLHPAKQLFVLQSVSIVQSFVATIP